MANLFGTAQLSPQYFRANHPVQFTSVNPSISFGAGQDAEIFVQGVTMSYVNYYQFLGMNQPAKTYTFAAGTYTVPVSGLEIRHVRYQSSDDTYWNNNAFNFYSVADPEITSFENEVLSVQNRQVRVSWSSTGNFNTSYTISWGDGQTSTVTGATGTAEHTYGNYGSFPIVFTVENRLGYTDTATTTALILPPPDVTLGDPLIRILTDDGYTTALVERTKYTRYIKTMSDGDSFEIALSHYDPVLQYIRPDTIMALPIQGYTRVVLVNTISDDGETVTISGDEYSTALFKRRVCLTDTTSGTGYDVQTGAAETLIRYFMTENVQTPPRTDTGWVLQGQDQQRGGNTTYSSRLETTYAVVTELCRSSGLGYDSVLFSLTPGDSLLVGCTVIEGVDRTVSTGGANAIVLGDERGTAHLTNFEIQSSPNVCYAGGQGSAASRVVLAVGLTNETGIARNEMFSDCREATDTDVLSAMGQRALENAALISITMESLVGSPYKFGSSEVGGDYYIGDTLTLDCGQWGIYDAQLQQVEISYSPQGMQEILTFGGARPGVMDEINRTRADIKDARR